MICKTRLTLVFFDSFLETFLASSILFSELVISQGKLLPISSSVGDRGKVFSQPSDIVSPTPNPLENSDGTIADPVPAPIVDS